MNEKLLFPQTYKTIKYRLYRNKRFSVTSVIFPKTGASLNDHTSLITSLTRLTNVLFIEKGYYGIGSITEPSVSFSNQGFLTRISQLLDHLQIKSPILLGESIGANHAIRLAIKKNINPSLVILSNPGIFKRSLVNILLTHPILWISIKTNPDLSLKFIIRLFQSIPIIKLKKLGNYFSVLRDKIGSESYIYCLSELVQFRKPLNNPTMIEFIKTCEILIGANDRYFNQFGDLNYCTVAKKISIVKSSGHDIFTTQPSLIAKRVQERLSL